jgi:two-component system, NarL family, response regulator NreC
MARPSRARKGGARIRVLLAEDFRVLREALADVLGREHDIEVVGGADDGLMAVEMAVRLRPDVVVMNVTMPHLNGVEATRRIKAKLPGVQVIGLSMHSDKTVIRHMTEAGAVAYLTKGSPIEGLIAAIRQHARQPR